MNETAVNEVSSQSVSRPRDFNLIDFLIILTQRKWLLIGLPLLVGLCAGLLSMILPNEYKGTTRILPPQQQSGAAALLTQLGGVAAAAAGAGGVKNPNDMYIGMLRSRTVADNLIKRFNLKAVYGKSFDDATRAKLESNTTITSGKDGLIVIDVGDLDPKRSADLANAYTDELMNLTRVLSLTEAAQRRVFFEQQLEQAKNNLVRAEATLKNTLGTRGVISVDSESRTIVETVAHLRAQIAAKQIQIGAMRAFVTVNNQEYKRSEQELASMRSELARLENGRPEIADGRAKKAGLENIQLLRDLKYHQMLYEMLSRQYELARLDEAKDSSIIQVLDKAVAPEHKFKPKRLLLTLAAMTLALFLVLGWAIFSDLKARVLRDPENARRLDILRSALRDKKAA